MELVRGIAITDYCDKCSLTPRERLKLFIQVCQAVQHAHQKGIIHRDLKPSNVMVTLHDGVPVPKVIDFGVAKAINQRLTEHTVYTRHAQMVGTPMYMSPEQAELSGLDVDTRSDVYSLGVLLYELLVGTTPFDKESFSKVSFDEMRRMIREDEPPRPSQRLSTLAAQARSTVSGKRGSDERKLSQTLRGELDWIVMKALEKDRQRRYESASAFAADVQRYLDDEPVAACPPSAAYRLRKYARRNKTTLTTAIVVSTALLVGTALSLWQAFEATTARKLADERLTLADERLVLADERLKNEQHARTDADTQRKQASANLQQALDAVDQMLMRVADDRLAAIPGAEEVRQELFQAALKFYDAFFEQAPDDPQLQIGMAKGWARVGSLHDFFRDITKAQDARQQAIRRWETLHAENRNDPEIQNALAGAYWELGVCDHWIRHKFASAEAALERANSLWRGLADRFPENLDYLWNAAAAESVLGDNFKCTGRLEQAERALRHAVDVQRQLWSRGAVSSNKHWMLVDSLDFLAVFLQEAKKRDDELETLNAEALWRAEEVVASAPQAAHAVRRLVHASHQYADYLLNVQRNVAGAEKHYRRAVEAGQLLPRVNPRDFDMNIEQPRAQLALASLLARDGRHSEAATYYRAAGDSVRPAMLVPEPTHHWTSIYASSQHGVLTSLGQLSRGDHRDEANKFCEELSQASGPDTEQLLCRLLAARAWLAISDVERGKQLISDVIEQLERTSAVPRRQRERVAIVRELSMAAGELGIVINRDPGFAARISVAIDEPLEFASGDNIGAYRERGALHAAVGQFSRARRDFESAVAAGNAGGHAGWYERYQRALCYLHDRDQSAFRTAAKEILSRFTASQDAKELHWTVWTCVLAPGGLDDYRPLVELARRNHGLQPKDLSAKQALGAALFRDGQFEQALRPLNECEVAPQNANTTPLYTQYFLAMTHHNLGHAAEARQWFNRAEAETTRLLADGETKSGQPLPWNLRLTLELLRGEATALLRETRVESLPKPHDGEPASPK